MAMSNSLDRAPETLHFYFNRNCPYAQRSWIALIELGIAYEPIEIELGKDNKTDWFRALNPNGTVPTIKHGETVVYESLVVNEYLCEVFGGDLMPSTPANRARARILMSRCDAKFVKLGYSYLSHKRREDETKDDQLRSQLEEELRFLDNAIGNWGGSYFLGDTLTLADIAFIPFFQRMNVALASFKNFKLENLNLPHLNAWLEAISHRDSCSQTQMSAQQIEEVYARFLNLDYFKRIGIAS
ncbi:glutathione S-transferase [Pleurocapsa sp. PCC 7327]|nr:glutathione S-transferase [Pleurocapsa sp. PCC 7327]